MPALHYALSGNHLTATPLVLLHGFTGSSRNWDDLVPAFATRQPVITIDITGHGRSPTPAHPAAYAMPRAAVDLIDVLDTLGVAQAALLGYSMGGRLALYTAVHYPARFTHLILEGASPGLATTAERQARRQRDEALADHIEADGIPAFVDFWEALPLWASQAQLPADKRATLRQQRLANRAAGLANSLRGMGTGVQPSLWSRLTDLTLPTLLITGEHDAKFRAINQKMVELLPNASLEIVASAGHTVHLERPSLFCSLVLNFLNSD